MGLLNAISRWKAENKRKKITRHRQQGTCPDCLGNGFHAMALNEFAYLGGVDEFKCGGCNGSGLFSDWESQ